MHDPPSSSTRTVLLGLLLGAAVAVAIVLGAERLLQDDAAVPVSTVGASAAAMEPPLDLPKPDAAQTVLLAGLDHRYADGPKSRSDTMLLVRLDPDAGATTLLSLPRDLRVEALGKKGRQKLNSAWFLGGASRLRTTIGEDVLGTPEDPFEIDQVVSVKFDAFSKTINKLGCLFAEVDRKYFVAPGAGHAQIDQPAGYQRLCGQDALAYVRYRIGDSDFLREARQANYLTEIRSQISPRAVIEGGLLEELTRFVRTTAGRGSELRSLATLAVYVTAKPTVRIVLGDLRDAGDGTGDVLTSPAALASARRRFLEPRAPKQQTTPSDPGETERRRPHRVRVGVPPSMTTDTAGARRIVRATRTAGIETWAPDVRLGRAAWQPEMSRGYLLQDDDGKPRWPSYHLVAAVGGGAGQFYGVQGTTWKQPPILALASDEIRIGGRTWRVQYDGKRVRRLIWQAPTGTYWVTNTLSNELTPREMYALAKSLRRVG